MKLKINLTERNVEKLMKLFGAESDGAISSEELVQTMVGEMDNDRAELVQKVFTKIDSDNDEKITIQEMKELFNPSESPDVITKKKTEKQVLAQFLDTAEAFFSMIVLLLL